MTTPSERQGENKPSQFAHDLPLLTTKLYIPPARPNLVPRPHLIDELDGGLRAGHRLTLLSAPAGFGKTTLVAEWICLVPLEVAWLSLDEGDNSPIQFFTYLIAALRQVDGAIGQTTRQLLRSPQLPPMQSLVAALINDISAAGTGILLVLDDYHLITSSDIQGVLQFLLEHQPPALHLVLSTRQDPPLPLHQLRARSQVTEIRERDLRFTPDEAAAFLNQTMGLRLSAKDVTALEARTEGWIAGLQLAALALHENEDDTQTFIARFAGSDRYVADYMVSEVLQRQPEEIRRFLRQTAILDRMNGSLCNAVTGRSDSQEILEQLEGANLFVIPVDHRRAWYRYHRLFAEVLRTMDDGEDTEDRAALHQRAARWYETHELPEQAVRHALAHAGASGDWRDAGRLIRLLAGEMSFGGDLPSVRNWLDALPDERVRADVDLATYKAWVLALTGDVSQAGEYAAAAQTGVVKSGVADADAHAGRLLAVRGFLAVFGRQEYEEAIDLASRALASLQEDQAHWRIIALWTLAESQERTTRITEAIATLREAQRLRLAHRGESFAATIEFFLATDLHLHGQRREAVAVCEEAIAWYTGEGGRVSPGAGIFFSLLGTLYYEASQLDLAREYLDQGLALSEELLLDAPIMLALGYAAPTLHAQGETGAALASLQKAYQIGSRSGPGDADWCLASEANIRLQQGDLAFALRWAQEAGLSVDDAPDYLRFDQYLVFSRLLLAQGRLREARPLLVRLERFAEERAFGRWLITTHILQALASEVSGDHQGARETLERAVRMAAPEEYVRAFLDEGSQIIALLPEVRPVAPAFVDQLLDFAGVLGERPGIVPQPLVEPLSERELEVLRLIAAGLSNREIAGELVIAVGTVKRHINNIYGKMDVHSRTQAVSRARELGILGSS